MLKFGPPMAENTTDNSTEIITRPFQDQVRRSHLNDENAILLLPVIIFVGFLMLIGAIGNSIVFYMYRTKSRGTTKGIFISVLATFDLMNCFIVMPFEIYDMRNQFNFESGELCKTMRFVEMALVMSSGFTLLAISVDRYVNLCVRTSRILFTPSRARKVCIFCVFLSLLFSWPSIIFAGTKTITHEVEQIEGSECSSFSVDNKAGKFYILALTLVFLISLLIMITLYSLIATKLYRRRRGSIHNGLLYLKDSQESKKFEEEPSEQSTKANEHCGYAIGKHGIRMKGSTLIFFSVTVLFFIGFLPHLIVRAIALAGKAFNDGGSTELLYNFLVRSYMLNSALNPFVYSIFHKRFRKDLIKAFQKCTCRQKT